jgi:hypothetical protein
MEVKEVAKNVSNFVNNYNSDHEGFIKEMNSEHRTLQQSFTKLCLRWIENVASDEYRFDLRNQDSHEACKKLVESFKKENDNFKPSEFLRLI